MLSIWRKKVYPIGIDLGSYSLKIVQVTGAEKGLELVAAAKAVVPEALREDPLELYNWYTDAIKELLAVKPFKGKRAVLSLPTRAMLIQHLRMPKMPEDQLEKTLPWEAQEKLPFHTAGALLRHITVGEVYEGEESMLEVILMAASRNVVQQHLELVRQTKIEIDSINVEACALVNGFSHLHAQSEGNKQAMMLVDLGQSCAKVVVAHGPKITFCRTISPETEEKTDEPVVDPSLLSVGEEPPQVTAATPPTAAAAPAAVATQVICQEKEETECNSEISVTRLVSEIRRCVQYHNLLFETEPIGKVIFVGGQAKNKTLCQQLARELGLPAQLGDPLARIPRENRTGRHSDLDPDQINSDWSIAFGLSLGEMSVHEN